MKIPAKRKGRAIKLKLTAPKTDVPDAPTVEQLRALAAKVSDLMAELFDAQIPEEKKINAG